MPRKRVLFWGAPACQPGRSRRLAAACCRGSEGVRFPGSPPLRERGYAAPSARGLDRAPPSLHFREIMKPNRVLLAISVALSLSAWGCVEDVGDCHDPLKGQDTVVVGKKVQYGGQAI